MHEAQSAAVMPAAGMWERADHKFKGIERLSLDIQCILSQPRLQETLFHNELKTEMNNLRKRKSYSVPTGVGFQ